MLRIQRALLTELALMLALTLGLLTAVIFGGLALNLLSRVGEGVGTPLLLDLMPRLLPTALVYSLPFAWLVSVSLVVGRWVNDHEITSLRAAGVRLRTLVLPVAAMSALLSVGGVALSAYAVPRSQRDLNEAKRDYIPVFFGSLKDVSRTVTLGNGRLSFDRFEDGAFWDVELDRRDGDGRLQTKIVARRLALEQVRLEAEEKDAGDDDGGERKATGLSLTFEDGYFFQVEAGGGTIVTPATGAPFHMAQVQQMGGATEFNTFFGLRRYLPRARDFDLPALFYAQERGDVWRSPPHPVSVGIHGRLALGCAALPMGLLALGMALLLPPSGRRVRDFLAAFLPGTLVFFPLFLASPALATAWPRAVPLAMWSPEIVLGILAATCLALAGRR